MNPINEQTEIGRARKPKSLSSLAIKGKVIVIAVKSSVAAGS